MLMDDSRNPALTARGEFWLAAGSALVISGLVSWMVAIDPGKENVAAAATMMTLMFLAGIASSLHRRGPRILGGALVIVWALAVTYLISLAIWATLHPNPRDEFPPAALWLIWTIYASLLLIWAMASAGARPGRRTACSLAVHPSQIADGVRTARIPATLDPH